MSETADPQDKKKDDAEVSDGDIDQAVNPQKDGFPVVGIGSSAGGLEALEQFFNNAPTDIDIAYIIVPHLDPYHPSILADLISRRTDMEVYEATEGMEVKRNKVYVIPPGKDMVIHNRILKLFKRKKDDGISMPIDFFFRSLADDLGLYAIAIILSGTGSDGSSGLRFVQANLGMVMVQSPDSAKYDGMPRSAIATGLADYVLPPSEMPTQISKYVTTLQAKIRDGKVGAPPRDTEALAKILRILRKETGHDFSQYKKNTINRRIERRMSIHQIEKKNDYADYILKNPEEIRMLFKDLLIEVTRFFREPEAFDELKEKIHEYVLATKTSDALFRAWVPGCATGEEAYSVAIILAEIMEETGKQMTVQIFGTDIDEDAIDVARAGEYLPSVSADVGKERLSKFFISTEDKLKVKKEIREMVIFAPQDVTRDPPFIRLDFISCRNLLIYFESILQRKVLETFNFSLVPNGILFLGPSESIGGFSSEYSTLDAKWKIYQRAPYTTPYPIRDITTLSAGRELPIIQFAEKKASNLVTAAKNTLVSDYSPPGVVINDMDEVVYFHGRTSKFLEHPSGSANLEIQNLLRDDIRFIVLNAMRESRATGKLVKKEGARVVEGENASFMNIIVTPLSDLRQSAARLVVFQEVRIPHDVIKDHQSLAISTDKDAYLSDVEKELQYTRENLQSTIEELETSNEELKSMNEELQSTNEELQSVAEESETGKEELHSLNEELMSVNSELERRNDDLSAANSDMKNLLNSIEVATIFLDRNMRIRRFTSQTERMMSILPTDVGRPIEDLALSLKYEGLVGDAKDVLNRLTSIEREVNTDDEHWFSIRILPYKTVDNVIDGVVITFVDISAQKKAQQRLEKLSEDLRGAKTYAEGIVNTIKQPLAVLNQNLEIVSANSAFLRTFEVAQDDIVGKPIQELDDGWKSKETLSKLNNVASGKGASAYLDIDLLQGSKGRSKEKVTIRRIAGQGDSTSNILLAFDEVPHGK